ncbi:PREDICTED: uncharacterized protein LOC104818144 [Tarenaya hassleriana]|uniref:uncharacterized protein LOC104818144 n=1 Tax=Tarenaya hassleriana TaxID=28532 RepID=UPI00053C49C7|nr:PREDICTED: uncharacterized protein LOC104818144 [Tarenaya hassleriana]
MAVGRHLEEDFEAPSDKENKSVTEKKETVENPGFVRETKPKSLANVNEERQNAKDECIRAQTPTRNNLVKIKDQGKATDLDAREEETIVILKGVTSLGNETFSSCTNQTREGMYHMCRNQCHVACHSPNQRKNLIKDGGTYKADVRNLEDESDVTSKAVTEHVTKEKETIKDSDLVLNEVLKSVINVDEELHGIRIDALAVVTRNEDLKILINPSTKINDTSNNRTWIISQELGAKTGKFIPIFILVYDSYLVENIWEHEEIMAKFQKEYSCEHFKEHTNKIVPLEVYRSSQVLNVKEVGIVTKKVLTSTGQIPKRPFNDLSEYMKLAHLDTRSLRGNIVLLFILVYDQGIGTTLQISCMDDEKSPTNPTCVPPRFISAQGAKCVYHCTMNASRRNTILNPRTIKKDEPFERGEAREQNLHTLEREGEKGKGARGSKEGQPQKV